MSVANGCVSIALSLLIASSALAQGLRIDDFQDGTTQGWTSGAANPNPPIWEPSGGPDGPQDGYLRIESRGQSGPGGNLVAFNTAQWSGDYLAAGIVAVRAELRNLGQSDLVIRLLVEGGGGSFLSAAAASLPAGGDGSASSGRWPRCPESPTPGPSCRG